jgi:DNA-binding beta-propeller fold protein YncE
MLHCTSWSQPTPTTVYVSDTSFGSILKFDATGQMTIFASGISAPTGLAFDNGGNLYVANVNRIEKSIRLET